MAMQDNQATIVIEGHEDHPAPAAKKPWSKPVATKVDVKETRSTFHGTGTDGIFAYS